MHGASRSAVTRPPPSARPDARASPEPAASSQQRAAQRRPDGASAAPQASTGRRGGRRGDLPSDRPGSPEAGSLSRRSLGLGSKEGPGSDPTCTRGLAGGMKGDLRAWLPGTGGGGPMGVLPWYPTLFWVLDFRVYLQCPLLNLGSLRLLEPGCVVLSRAHSWPSPSLTSCQERHRCGCCVPILQMRGAASPGSLS